MNFIIGILMLSPMFPAISHSQENHFDDQIILEEVEINLMEGDKVKEKKFGGQSRDAYRVFEEIKKGGMPPRQRVAMRTLKPPKLRFLDRQGKTIKEYALGMEVYESSGSAVSKPGVVKVRSSLTRKAGVSKSGKYAFLLETRGTIEFTGTPNEGDGYQGATSRLQCLDAQGNVVWEKTLPEARMAETCKISSDGNRIFCLEQWTKFGRVARDFIPPLIVRDRSGAETFQFPLSSEAGYHLQMGSGDLVISPNGRYAGIRAMKNKMEIVLFIDIDKGSHWDLEMPAVPVDISNEGLARVERLVGARSESVDLKEKL